MKKSGHITLSQIVPSILTVFAICAGMTSVRMCLDGRLEAALYCILLAVILDAADGKLARLLDTASPFGAELDTLADFFNFGVAPGILLYHTFYYETEYASAGWLAVLVLAVCCALRLARFNLSMRSPDTVARKEVYFCGVPAPALACLALMPVFLHLLGWQAADRPFFGVAYIIMVGMLAVSTLPTLSIKHVSVRRSQLPVLFLVAASLAVCLVVYPWPTLVIANCIYLGTIPFCYFSNQRQLQKSDEDGMIAADTVAENDFGIARNVRASASHD